MIQFTKAEKAERKENVSNPPIVSIKPPQPLRAGKKNKQSPPRRLNCRASQTPPILFFFFNSAPAGGGGLQHQASIYKKEAPPTHNLQNMPGV